MLMLTYAAYVNTVFRRDRNASHFVPRNLSSFFWFSCRFGGSDLCWRAWPMDAAAIVENAGNSGRERRLGKGCEHVQTWSGVFHNRLENASVVSQFEITRAQLD